MRKTIRLAQNKDEFHDLGSEDLLSLFSDDILVSILSYLPLKDAAVTSALSRRWRYLWCHTVRLHFDDKERSIKIRRPICFKKRFDTVIAERNKYINWINRVIRQHKSPAIEEFKICFNLDKNAKGAIGKWIEFAVSKNVQTLELDLWNGWNLYHNGNYVFPNKIFDRKYKSSLLRSSFNVSVRPCTTSMEIKFLKALILKHVDVDDECLKKILSNCPVLEHLFIHRSCKLVKAKIQGKGLALKNLEILFCEGLESIEIFDSNIVSIHCRDSDFDVSPISLRLNNLLKLEKFSFLDRKMKINDMFCQISCCISYLQVLELGFYRLQEDMQFFLFPELPKLKQLIMEVEAWDAGCLSLLNSLVEACPNLQRFTIKILWVSITSGLINRETSQAAKQSHQHLEVVEIRNYHGQTSEIDMVTYFFENSVALKKLVIKPYIAAYETAEAKNGGRYRAQQQLEPITPFGVELVIL